jgi:hypothetical protein
MNDQPFTSEEIQRIHDVAANLIIEQKKSHSDAVEVLISNGLDRANANAIVTSIIDQHTQAKKDNAKNDMIFGACWFVGGIVATAADFGYIFWGAIVFGLYQFLRGAFAK